jgi:hypothetical protein
MEKERMMSSKRSYLLSMLVSVLAIFSCNLPAGNPTPAQPLLTPVPTSSSPNLNPGAPPITHLSTPSDVSLKGNINYDVDSSGNASRHRAPYGDVYEFNRLERPFTQGEMTYLPNVDITRFRLESDQDWVYVFIELIGSNPNDPLNIDYGVEIDKDRDGFGEVLLWAHPPYAVQWSTDNVSVYSDSDHDSGGLSAIKSDAPFNGNGYDTLVFGQGQGQDPDLAWVRIDPQNPNVIEFAFKPSLPGKSFMWSTWADAELKDPSKFSYNDKFTEAEAGSSEADNYYYPLKAIYATDSTCRATFGFKPTGYEPLICPPIQQPVPTKEKVSCPPPPPSITFVCNWDPVECKCK